ncbi:MAG: putative toxin-antitoxin system toxin component, PIN family [Chloroflexi bacterium]|nr:putative toxin-antitoxin system toxin component, PIN family [Chloroflexota bacterium]
MQKLKRFGRRSTPRVVIDTNLFVRGLMNGPVTRPLIEAWKQKRFTLVTSEALLTEIVTVLARPKFRRYFALADVTELVQLIVEQGEIVEPTVRLQLCRDPKDNVFLDIAVTGHCNFLVTGDDDLKGDDALKSKMQNTYGVSILSAPEFIRALDAPQGCLPF